MYLSSDQKKIDYLSFDKIELILLKAKARIAQLVERNLAKVEVAGSNPVSRSISHASIWLIRSINKNSSLEIFVWINTSLTLPIWSLT